MSAKGIEVDAQKVAAVYRMKAPENAKQVKSFLGMAGFYRQFIDKFAQRAGPLTELLQKDVAFQWGEAQQKSFEDLKKAMTSTPVLVFPDFFQNNLRCTQMQSGCGIAATLIQRDHEGKPHPITFLSRKLKKEEMAYPPAELECLAIVWATAMLGGAEILGGDRSFWVDILEIEEKRV